MTSAEIHAKSRDVDLRIGVGMSSQINCIESRRELVTIL
jgi:hypothetical protein